MRGQYDHVPIIQDFARHRQTMRQSLEVIDQIFSDEQLEVNNAIELMGDTARAALSGTEPPQQRIECTKADDLRDMFAAHIASGILAGGWANTVPLDDYTHAEQLAGFAYAGANAMFHERESYRASLATQEQARG